MPEWNDEATRETPIDLILPDLSRRPPILRQISGPGAPRDFLLMRDRIVVGRSSTVNICVDALELSRQHMELERVGCEYRCTDLMSRNGVYLNGVKVHSCILRPGDTIQIGNVAFAFHEVGG